MGYFDSVLGAKLLYDACILGRETLQLQMERPRWSHRAAIALRWGAWTAALLLAWSVVIGAIGYIFGSQILLTMSQAASILLLGFVAIIWFVGSILDAVHRLKLGG